jgi:hypothetical protein
LCNGCHPPILLHVETHDCGRPAECTHDDVALISLLKKSSGAMYSSDSRVTVIFCTTMTCIRMNSKLVQVVGHAIIELKHALCPGKAIP